VRKTGFVVGKFYPPHRGHKYLIDTARAAVDHLTVMICGRPDYTIPTNVRAGWLREIHPDVEVIEVLDTLGDDDSEGWANYVRETLGYVPDMVFTSEDYGDRFCRFLGSRHVLVDKARIAYPCSGTLVRDDALSMWDCLEPCVRAYFVRRIAVVGAESTGTTTTARALAERYNTIWVPEYGREYSEAKYQPGVDGQPPLVQDWSTEEFVHIAQRQNEMEDAAARETNRVLFCDTTAFATSLWHRRYTGYDSPEVDALAAGRRYDLILLTDIDIPFIQDGLRDGEHIRSTMHHWFVDMLSAQSTPWVLLSGPLEERLSKASKMIDEMVKRR
jgi:HTH-type transcriptional repressor of NAD biosynthesis genes